MTIDIEKLAKDIFGTVLVNGNEYYELDANGLKQFAEAYASELKADNENLVRINNLQAQEIVELQAHINDLREALNMMRDAFDVGGDVTSVENDALYKADNALSKTPAQHINDDVRIFTKDSLQSFENEVIEMCAKVCDESYAFDSDGFAKEIRALKGK